MFYLGVWQIGELHLFISVATPVQYKLLAYGYLVKHYAILFIEVIRVHRVKKVTAIQYTEETSS
jgi:hypothetical protein